MFYEWVHPSRGDLPFQNFSTTSLSRCMNLTCASQIQWKSDGEKRRYTSTNIETALLIHIYLFAYYVLTLGSLSHPNSPDSQNTPASSAMKQCSALLSDCESSSKAAFLQEFGSLTSELILTQFFNVLCKSKCIHGSSIY